MILTFLVVNDRRHNDTDWDVSIVHDLTTGFTENFLGRMPRGQAACAIGEQMLQAERVSKVAWENLGPALQAFILSYIKPTEWGVQDVIRGYQFWAMFTEGEQT